MAGSLQAGRMGRQMQISLAVGLRFMAQKKVQEHVFFTVLATVLRRTREGGPWRTQARGWFGRYACEPPLGMTLVPVLPTPA